MSRRDERHAEKTDTEWPLQDLGAGFQVAGSKASTSVAHQRGSVCFIRGVRFPPPGGSAGGEPWPVSVVNAPGLEGRRAAFGVRQLPAVVSLPAW